MRRFIEFLEERAALEKRWEQASKDYELKYEELNAKWRGTRLMDGDREIAGVVENDRGLYVRFDRGMTLDKIPELIAWLRATFEDP